MSRVNVRQICFTLQEEHSVASAGSRKREAVNGLDRWNGRETPGQKRKFNVQAVFAVDPGSRRRTIVVFCGC